MTSNKREIWVKDLEANLDVRATFMLQSIKEGQTKTGEPYLTITVADKTGSLDVKAWRMARPELPFNEGAFALVEFSTEDYKGKLQGKFVSIANAQEAIHAPDFH